MDCVCGRPFVPEEDLYHAHVRTPEHQRWRMEQETGRSLTRRELFEMTGLPWKRRVS